MVHTEIHKQLFLRVTEKLVQNTLEKKNIYINTVKTFQIFYLQFHIFLYFSLFNFLLHFSLFISAKWDFSIFWFLKFFLVTFLLTHFIFWQIFFFRFHFSYFLILPYFLFLFLFSSHLEQQQHKRIITKNSFFYTFYYNLHNLYTLILQRTPFFKL